MPKNMRQQFVVIMWILRLKKKCNIYHLSENQWVIQPRAKWAKITLTNEISNRLFRYSIIFHLRNYVSLSSKGMPSLAAYFFIHRTAVDGGEWFLNFCGGKSCRMVFSVIFKKTIFFRVKFSNKIHWFFIHFCHLSEFLEFLVF